MAQVLTHLGNCAVFAGEAVEANRLLHEAQRHWEALGNVAGLGLTLFYLGRAADAAGDAAVAGVHYREALGPSVAVGDAHLTGFVRCFLGVAEWRRGEVPDAVEHIRAAVRTSISLQERVLLGVAAQATVALTGGDADPAWLARLLGALDALVRATGAPVAWERMPGGKDAAGLRERLARGEEGEESAAAYREGQSLHSGAMAAFALALLEEAAQTLAEPQGEDMRAPQAAMSAQSSAGQPASPLSPRETAVVRLVAEGLTSKEIGRRLFIAPSTVNYHLTSIFNKLGVDTRAQAVAVAIQRDLL
jgi:DNA-binding CsgD family transcriptional regulator